MKILRALGEAVAFGSIVAWIYVFIMLTISGLNTGTYMIILDSNSFNEHYIELFLFVAGLISYIYYRKIRFTLHPNKIN